MSVFCISRADLATEKTNDCSAEAALGNRARSNSLRRPMLRAFSKIVLLALEHNHILPRKTRRVDGVPWPELPVASTNKGLFSILKAGAMEFTACVCSSHNSYLSYQNQEGNYLINPAPPPFFFFCYHNKRNHHDKNLALLLSELEERLLSQQC